MHIPRNAVLHNPKKTLFFVWLLDLKELKTAQKQRNGNCMFEFLTCATQHSIPIQFFAGSGI